MPHPIETHQRQVHLVVHTARHFPGIAADFATLVFATPMKRAQEGN